MLALAGLGVWGLPVAGSLRGGSGQFQAAGSGYERANRLFERATGQAAYAGLQVLLEARGGVAAGVSAAGVQRHVGALLAREHGFQRVQDWRPGGHGVLLMAAFGTPAESVAASRRLRDWAASGIGRRRLAGWRMLAGGPDVAFGDLEARTRAAAQRVELLAAPLLLAMCLLVFGGVACVLPMLVGLVSVLVVFAVLRLLDLLGVEISIYALPAVTGLALGLSVDYSLLLVGRYREQTHEKTGRPVALAGQTVILSSLTIAAAMLCLTMIPLGFLTSVGVAGALTAVTAGATARLLIPAALRAFGGTLAPAPRVLRSPGRRGWQHLAGRVSTRPLPIAGITIVLLLAAGTPLLGLSWQPPSAQLLPAAAESRKLEDALAKEHGPDAAAAIYTIYKPARNGISADALAELQAHAIAGRAQITRPRYLGAGTWQITVLPHGPANSPANQRLLTKIQTSDTRAGAAAGGITAFAADQQHTISGALPLAIAILTLVIATSLWIATGSVVIAAKGVLMAALSATAGIGLLVAIVGPIEEADLIFMSTIALALSADYELFLISRIAEARQHGLPNTAAVTAGLRRTGPLISSAALLFITAVAPLALSSLSFARQFGIGAALTIAIDATLVRALLVPALMVLLAERNWWSPAILARLHTRIQILQRNHAPDRDSRPAAGQSAARRMQRCYAATQTGGD